MTMRLLLLSNSTQHGQGYLDHAMPAMDHGAMPHGHDH